MCGIAGIARTDGAPIDRRVLARMAAAIRHRGPDDWGHTVIGSVGFAHVRLSIVDIAAGVQPMGNEDGRVVIVYNGEVYNHVELRRELEARGHKFRTHCDTEALVHAYEEWGEEMLPRLNGQFAFAIHDARRNRIFMARDRFGVRPLFYAQRDGNLVFGSEIKAILASGEVSAAPDPAGLDEVFTFWAARPPRTPFRDILSLEPGCCATWEDGQLRTRRYYHMEFNGGRHEPSDAIEQLDALMRTSVAFRMRADVPVGGYLSGGIDSSVACALAADASPYQLRTFSVAFADPSFDESSFQREAAQRVRSMHAVQQIDAHDIASAFPDVIRHTETPLVRTAPAPLYLLSKLTRDNGIKVVLTGEGADEVFLGYDLFKETVVRRFCLRQPESTRRRQLFDRLYPYLTGAGRGGEFWRSFFMSAGDSNDPLFSHAPRIALTSRIKDFYSADMRMSLAQHDVLADLRAALPPEFANWSSLDKAAYLEFNTLLSPYLLSSQADRMAMAHSVEARFPFLDHRVFEFAASLPSRSKLRGLKEKDILRRWATRVIAQDQAARPKQPYRAPDIPAFFGKNQPEYVAEVLSPEAIADVGIFDPRATEGLLRRCRSGMATGFRESQALVGILSTQLWHRQFCTASLAAEQSAYAII